MYFVGCDANTTFQQSSVHDFGARWSTTRRRQSQPVGNGGTKWFVRKYRVSVNPLLCCGAGNVAGGIFITLITLFFVVFTDFCFAFGMCTCSTEEKRCELNSWKENNGKLCICFLRMTTPFILAYKFNVYLLNTNLKWWYLKHHESWKSSPTIFSKPSPLCYIHILQ